jgi:o-succinylbenzoate---CoA ligase
MHDLRLVDAGDPLETMGALRSALSGGPAVLPVHANAGATAQPRDGSAGVVVGPPSSVDKRIALVVETSGSSAKPKRVALSGDALLAAAAASESALDGPGQWLLALPAFYIAGIGVLVRSISAATVPVVMELGGFTAERFVSAASALEHSRRFTSLVPAQLTTLMQSRAAIDALRQFDRVLVGGQALSAELVAVARDEGVRVTRTYGASETAGGCVYDGEPIGMTAVRIVDGQIELAGPTLAEGYLDDESRTADAFVDDDGTRWYRTGDSGEFDGVRLNVTGRLDDTIISGGVKVVLGELESFIAGHTTLTDAVVTSELSERWGEVPVVVTTHAMPLDELRTLVEAALGVAATPSRIVTIEALPVLPSGKPDRLAIRAALGR